MIYRDTQLVPRTSAVVPGMVNAEAIGLDKDHVDMCKFSSWDDGDFNIIYGHLQQMIKKAPAEIAKKRNLQPLNSGS